MNQEREFFSFSKTKLSLLHYIELTKKFFSVTVKIQQHVTQKELVGLTKI